MGHESLVGGGGVGGGGRGLVGGTLCPGMIYTRSGEADRLTEGRKVPHSKPDI